MLELTADSRTVFTVEDKAFVKIRQAPEGYWFVEFLNSYGYIENRIITKLNGHRLAKYDQDTVNRLVSKYLYTPGQKREIHYPKALQSE